MIDQDNSLERLKALDILQIASDLGRQPNRSNMISCPIHNEKTPSLKLDPQKGLFKCFGCGKGGSTIDLYAGALGLDFASAVKEMKARYLGIMDGQPGNVIYRQAKPVPTREALPAQRPAEEFSVIYESLQRFCTNYGPTESKRKALEYLKSRAFSVNTIKRFGLFVIPDPKITANYLTDTFPLSELEDSGLFNKKGHFVLWKHFLIIPYLKNGRIVNLQARYIGEAPKDCSKYQFLNSRPIVTPFNIDAVQGVPEGSKVYLTEGAFDAMAVTQLNGTAVSINSATGFKSEWVQHFTRMKVCFFLDSDRAGQDAIKKLAPLFQKEGMRLTEKRLIAGCKDVNEWLIQITEEENRRMAVEEPNGYPAFWDTPTQLQD